MKAPKGKKDFDILTIGDLIELLQMFPRDYYVFTEEEGCAHNLIWENIEIDTEDEVIFLG